MKLIFCLLATIVLSLWNTALATEVKEVMEYFGPVLNNVSLSCYYPGSGESLVQQQEDLCEQHEGHMAFVVGREPERSVGREVVAIAAAKAASLGGFPDEGGKDCAPGFTRLRGQPNCYAFVPEKANCSEAHVNCTFYSPYAYLAIVDNEDEAEALRIHIKNKMGGGKFLVADHNQKVTRWMWEGAQVLVTYEFWRVHSYARGKKDTCVALSTKDNDRCTDCKYAPIYVCESDHHLWKTLGNSEIHTRCPRRFDKIGNFGCYYFSRATRFLWGVAHAECLELGSYLAIPDSMEENEALKDHLLNVWNSPAALIGANDRKEEGAWRWRGTNSPVLFSDWDEPREYDDRDCSAIMKEVNGTEMHWKQIRCIHVLPFICETDQRQLFHKGIPLVSVHCPKYFVKLGSMGCYFFSGLITSTWEGAKSYCQKLGGYLVSIQSDKENNALRNYMKFLLSIDHYIGANDLEESGRWIWEHSQSPLFFSDWLDDSLVDGHCALMEHQLEYRWNRTDCSSRQSFICETEERIWMSSRSPNINLRCPPEFYEVNFQGCYYYSQPMRMTYDDAVEKCSEMKSTLLKIDTSSEQDAIVKYISSSNVQIYVGDRSNIIDHDWIWMKSKWLSVECDGLSFEEGDNGQVNSTELNCTKELRFVCETQPRTLVQKDKPCPEPYMLLDTGCYYLSDISVTWQEAMNACHSMNGGVLATIDDAQESEGVRSHLDGMGRDNKYWIHSFSASPEHRPGADSQWESVRKANMMAPFCIVANSESTVSESCAGKSHFICELELS